MNIPLFRVHMPGSVMEPLQKVLMSGYIGQGPKVEEFEKALVPWVGNPNCLTVNSGTSALHLAMRLAGVERGTEVISTPTTCSATNEPILERGGGIVWADIDPWTGNIDPMDVERKITGKTKAIIAVHWGGYPCELDELLRISRKYGIALIEDAAHAFGATYRGRQIGSHSSFVCFSFQAIKLLTTVDGGLLVCPSMDDYRRGKLLRWFGIDRETPRKDLRCLHPKTKILLADGTKMEIRDFVRTKHPGPVMVVEEGGEVVPAKVKGWFKNKKQGRKLVAITTEGMLRKDYTILTDDHKVLTPSGMVAAGLLRNGDPVASSRPAPSSLQRQIIVGSLLGDGTMGLKERKSGVRRTVLTETHSMIQAEYVRLKAEALSGLEVKVFETAPNLQQKRPNGSICYYTPSLPSLAEIGRAFYVNRKKVVPRDLVEKEFGPLMLAVFFMDDGSVDIVNQREGLVPYCQLATNAFSESDVSWFASFLSKKGFESEAKYNKDGWRIFFTKKGSRKLVDTVSPYVPPSLRYKVGHDSRIPFDRFLWGDGQSVVHYDRAVIMNVAWKGEDVYCIEVDHLSHNFATSSVIVGNCEEDIKEAGYKFHLSDVLATIGLEQLKYTKDLLDRTRANAKFYDDSLGSCKKVKRLKYQTDRLSSYWLYTVRVNDRDAFQDFMKKKEIMVSQVHVRNDVHTAFKAFRRNLPGVDEFTREQVSIPVGWWLTDEDRNRVVSAIAEWDAQ
jgi:dTDP-4-amino-4,6-dideoxygalactose transaminase